MDTASSKLTPSASTSWRLLNPSYLLTQAASLRNSIFPASLTSDSLLHISSEEQLLEDDNLVTFKWSDPSPLTNHQRFHEPSISPDFSCFPQKTPPLTKWANSGEIKLRQSTLNHKNERKSIGNKLIPKPRNGDGKTNYFFYNEKKWHWTTPAYAHANEVVWDSCGIEGFTPVAGAVYQQPQYPYFIKTK